MRKLGLLILLIAALSFVLVACGSSDSSSSDTGSSDGEAGASSAARGEELYKHTTIGAASAPGCITCHSLDEGVSLVGPSHYQVGAGASNIIPGKSAEEYLKESIVNPDAHITEGFSPGVMYPNYANDLSDQEINDLVAFLNSLQ
jgi:cytochrome c553